MLTAGLPELTSVKDIQYLKVFHSHTHRSHNFVYFVHIFCVESFFGVSVLQENVEEEKSSTFIISNELHTVKLSWVNLE